MLSWVEDRPAVRWALVIPGSLGAAIAALFPLHWVILIGTAGQDSDGLSLWDLPPRRLEQFGAALVVPLTIVYVAAKIAPAHRFGAAMVVAIVLTAGLGLLYGSALGGGLDLNDRFPLNILPLVFNAIGIAVGVNSARGLPASFGMR